MSAGSASRGLLSRPRGRRTLEGAQSMRMRMMLCRPPSTPPRRQQQSAVALNDPRPGFGSYSNRNFRPSSSGSMDSGSLRNEHAAKWREARQEVKRKREEAEAAERQRIEEEEEKYRNPLTPDEVLQQCLTLLRKADTDSLRELCAQGTVAESSYPLLVGDESVVESGPLARCQELMDAAARRVLPGHLLRRSRVLSVFRPTDSSFQARVAVTGCTGEEVVLFWRLGRDRHGLWRVDSVGIDTIEGVPSNFAEAEVHHPHPRVPPEAVVRAQVDLLREGNAAAAEAFTVRCGAGSPGLFASREGEALVVLLGAAARPPALGSAALPSQRRFLQEVVVEVGGGGSSGASSSSSRGGDGSGSYSADATSGGTTEVSLVWGLSLQGNGCWMVDSVSTAKRSPSPP